MFEHVMLRVLPAAALVFFGAADLPAAEADLVKAFDALKAYQWGQDRVVLKAIDDAVMGSHNDAAARKSLETRLAAVLSTGAPAAAKNYACRQLSLIGSGASVPALAALLPDKDLSHMARYALERIPGDETVAALRDSLTKVSGLQKVGVINSLAARRDAAAVGSFSALLSDADPQIAAAATAGLGNVGNSEAAASLSAFAPKAPKALQAAVADASLHCAERLLAAGKKAEATALYKELSKPAQPKHVRVAAMRGLLAATPKK